MESSICKHREPGQGAIARTARVNYVGEVHCAAHHRPRLIEATAGPAVKPSRDSWGSQQKFGPAKEAHGSVFWVLTRSQDSPQASLKTSPLRDVIILV